MTGKFVAFGVMLLAINPALADSLDNLERERATAVLAMLNPSLDNEERAVRLEKAKRRLVDLERMVLREDGHVAQNTPKARVAFSNYDLTFLVHAASENGLTIFDQWFDQVGLKTDTIMAATPRRR